MAKWNGTRKLKNMGDGEMIISLKELKERKENEDYQEFIYWYGLEDNNKSWVLYNTWNLLGDNIKALIIYGDVSNY